MQFGAALHCALFCAFFITHEYITIIHKIHTNGIGGIIVFRIFSE